MQCSKNKKTSLVQSFSNHLHGEKSIYSFLFDAWKDKSTDPENKSLFILGHIHNPLFLIAEKKVIINMPLESFHYFFRITS